MAPGASLHSVAHGLPRAEGVSSFRHPVLLEGGPRGAGSCSEPFVPPHPPPPLLRLFRVFVHQPSLGASWHSTHMTGGNWGGLVQLAIFLPIQTERFGVWCWCSIRLLLQHATHIFFKPAHIQQVIYGFSTLLWTIRVPSDRQKTKMFATAAQDIVILEIVNIHMHKEIVEGCGRS